MGGMGDPGDETTVEAAETVHMTSPSGQVDVYPIPAWRLALLGMAFVLLVVCVALGAAVTFAASGQSNATPSAAAPTATRSLPTFSPGTETAAPVTTATSVSTPISTQPPVSGPPATETSTPTKAPPTPEISPSPASPTPTPPNLG